MVHVDRVVDTCSHQLNYIRRLQSSNCDLAIAMLTLPPTSMASSSSSQPALFVWLAAQASLQ